jgi:hypothetical protein
VRRRASLAAKTVTEVSQGKHTDTKPRKRTASKSARSSSVSVREMHPALKMAHDLGIDPERIQIIEDEDNPAFIWGCIILNEPPVSTRKRGQS